MRVAYFTTEYPHVTHTFIRREIRGVEKCGIEVLRATVRRPELGKLPDPDDQQEWSSTVGILDRGSRMLLDCVWLAARRPGKWLHAAWRAIAWGWRSNRGLTRHLAYFVEACSLARVMHEQRVDHVHAHFGESSTMVVLLARVLGGPAFSFQVHGPGEFDAPKLLHLPQKVAAARFVCAISDYARGQVLRWSAPEHWQKVHVVRCGVDALFLAAAPPPITSTSRLVSIGRLSASKAQPLLIDAAHRLAQEGRTFELIVIGAGELRGHLERMIAERGLRDVVKLAGVMSGAAVKNELLQARALVLPSFGEGLPVVLMEALALGRPVIATQIAGIPELVEHGRNGWLIPAGNVDAVVDAMRAVLDAKLETLTAMGAAGRAAVAAKHDADREAAKLAELFLTTRAEQRA
jgi:colanic acid/amylovoran biosynthesis glycosyltransferase